MVMVGVMMVVVMNDDGHGVHDVGDGIVGSGGDDSGGGDGGDAGDGSGGHDGYHNEGGDGEIEHLLDYPYTHYRILEWFLTYVCSYCLYSEYIYLFRKPRIFILFPSDSVCSVSPAYSLAQASCPTCMWTCAFL